MSIQLDLASDPAVAAQIRAAVLEAPLRPEFLRALLSQPEFCRVLKEALTPENVWLSHDQAREVVGLKRTAFYAWLKRRAGKLAVSHELGPKEPRIRLSSILALMDARQVCLPLPLPSAPAAARPSATPPPPRQRIPAVPLRDVVLR